MQLTFRQIILADDEALAQLSIRFGCCVTAQEMKQRLAQVLARLGHCGFVALAEQEVVRRRKPFHEQKTLIRFGLPAILSGIALFGNPIIILIVNLQIVPITPTIVAGLLYALYCTEQHSYLINLSLVHLAYCAAPRMRRIINYWTFLLLLLVSCNSDSRERANVSKPDAAEFNLIPFRQQQLWGFADTTGKIVIQPSYQEVEFYNYGVARVRRGELWGLIDTEGKQVLKPTYTKIEEFFNGHASVISGDKQGVINYNGEVVVPVEDHIIRPLAHGEGKPYFYEVHKLEDYTPKFIKELFRMRIVQDKKGLYDDAGNLLLPVRYDYIHYLGEGYTVGMKGDSIFDYLLEKDGRLEKLPQSRLRVGQFKDGIAPASQGDKYGFVDKNLKQVIDFQYASAKNFRKGLAPVMQNGLFGFIDIQNQVVVPFVYQEVSDFNNGVAIARAKDRYGLISEKGLPLTKFIYNSIRYSDHTQLYELRADSIFRQTRLEKDTNKLFYMPESYYIRGEAGSHPISAVATQDGKHGFVDSTGKVSIPFEYNLVSEFKHDLAVVEDVWKKGVINRKNEIILPLRYNRVMILNNNILLVEEKHNDGSLKVWFVDRNGQEFSSIRYDKVDSDRRYAKKLLLFSDQTQKWSIIDVSGDKPEQLLELPPHYTVTNSSAIIYATKPRNDAFTSRFIKVSDRTTGKSGYIGLSGLKFFEG